MGRLSNLGTDVYPTETANRRGSRIGITPLRKCVQCGLPNDTRRTTWAKFGDGLVTTSGATDLRDQTAAAGCRFCGSFKWQKHKPATLPDDQFLSLSKRDRSQ